MRLSPDELIFWHHGLIKLNGTIVFTWALMAVLAAGSKLITRNLATDLKRSPWQNLLEMVVTGLEKQIQEVGLPHPEKYLGFLGTLFLFVAMPRRRPRFPPRRPWPCASSGPYRCSASRSRAWGATSNPMCSRR
jgi:hypothetical protein